MENRVVLGRERCASADIIVLECLNGLADSRSVLFACLCLVKMTTWLDKC